MTLPIVSISHPRTRINYFMDPLLIYCTEIQICATIFPFKRHNDTPSAAPESEFHPKEGFPLAKTTLLLAVAVFHPRNIVFDLMTTSVELSSHSIRKCFRSIEFILLHPSARSWDGNISHSGVFRRAQAILEQVRGVLPSSILQHRVEIA